MVNIYSNIAVTPGIGSYPLVNTQTNGTTSDAADAAHFQHILDKLAAQAQQAQSQTRTQGTNFAMTKAAGWTSAPASSSAASADTPSSSSATAAASGSGAPHSFKNFMKNLWDVVNPLQHIPVVSAIYRHATGDTISDGAHFAGDALYGGVIGGAISMADIAFKKITGHDTGETVIASLTGKGTATPSGSSGTLVAQNLTQLTPASGGQTTAAAPTTASAGKKIIWSSNSIAANSGSLVAASTSPLFPPSGTIGVGSATPSISAQPILQANSAASTGTIQTQEAPAGMSRKAMSPELIASRMMEGLQKYAQMQQQNLNPQLSGLY